MYLESEISVCPVSVWIMNAIAAGPGFPRAPPSEKMIKCLLISVPPDRFLFFNEVFGSDFCCFCLCCCRAATSFYKQI